jgi:hypothetical protein
MNTTTPFSAHLHVWAAQGAHLHCWQALCVSPGTPRQLQLQGAACGGTAQAGPRPLWRHWRWRQLPRCQPASPPGELVQHGQAVVAPRVAPAPEALDHDDRAGHPHELLGGQVGPAHWHGCLRPGAGGGQGWGSRVGWRGKYLAHTPQARAPNSAAPRLAGPPARLPARQARAMPARCPLSPTSACAAPHLRGVARLHVLVGRGQERAPHLGGRWRWRVCGGRGGGFPNRRQFARSPS